MFPQIIFPKQLGKLLIPFQSDMKNNEKIKLVRDGTTYIEPEDINL